MPLSTGLRNTWGDSSCPCSWTGVVSLPQSGEVVSLPFSDRDSVISLGRFGVWYGSRSTRGCLKIILELLTMYSFYSMITYVLKQTNMHIHVKQYQYSILSGDKRSTIFSFVRLYQTVRYKISSICQRNTNIFNIYPTEMQHPWAINSRKLNVNSVS